jgi:hypothetical protein
MSKNETKNELCASSFTSLSLHVLSYETDTLPFVRLRNLGRANKSCEISNLLLIDTGNVNNAFFFFIGSNRDALGSGENNLVRKTNRKSQF